MNTTEREETGPPPEAPVPSAGASGEAPVLSAGAFLRARAEGAHTEALGRALAALDPELLEWADEFIFGRVWQRPGLPFEDRMLVAITALATQRASTQLRNYLHGALQDGLDPDRIREALVMLVVYAGFPTAIEALAVFREVLDAHGRRAGAGS
jgi:4-carboxymuconolactone decarboxylase